MTRPAKLLLAFALAAVAIPGATRAQEPKDTKVTKEARKLITLASVKQNPAEQVPLFQQAVGMLQEGMQKDANNPTVWLLAGTAYAGAGQYAAADSALKKAETLHPAFASEIAAVREKAWMGQFQKGAQALDRNQADSALALLREAEMMYAERPEGVLNMGVIYLNSQKYPEARQALTQAKTRLNGPLFAKLKPEDQAQWKSWDKLIDNLEAQMESNEGINAFQGEKYAEAVEHFAKANTINPYSRDHVYNLAESYFAQTTRLEKTRKDAEDAKPATATTAASKKAAAAADSAVKKADTELAPLYTKQLEVAQNLLTFEPYSSDAYIMIAKAYMGQANATADATAKTALRAKMNAALESAQKLPFELEGLQVTFPDTVATMAGKVKNHSLKAGEHAKLKVIYVAADGSVAGTGDLDVAVGAADSSTPFEVKSPVKPGVAGWKYEAPKP